VSDYTYPSIFFANFLFLLFLVGAVFFFVRSFRQGYWGPNSEEPKFRMLEDDDSVAGHSGEHHGK
jgi:hypothetical protein